MKFVELIFWSFLLIIFYTYLGYGITLYIITRLGRLFNKKTRKNIHSHHSFPHLTLLVAAYNEEAEIINKIENSLSLHYPKDKLQLIFVTDGSNDKTPELVTSYSEILHLHRSERRGKLAAVHRAMEHVKGEITVFTDANTILNANALENITRHFADPKVGAVAGEKCVISEKEDAAAGAGEGFYWKYENALKRWDSELYSVVGAAGELFAIRTRLYEAVPPDSIIEDFYMTLRIAQKGYRVVYEPEAKAMEHPSANAGEELKRKIRIAAGGIQSIVRLKPLLNVFKYGTLSFQYISHRVLRWTLAPLGLFFVLLCNIILAFSGSSFYQILLLGQLLFYTFALVGYCLENRKLKLKVFFIPYYFFLMNYAVYAGFIRYLKGRQTVLWERAKRQTAQV